MAGAITTRVLPAAVSSAIPQTLIERISDQSKTSNHSIHSFSFISPASFFTAELQPGLPLSRRLPRHSLN